MEDKSVADRHGRRTAAFVFVTLLSVYVLSIGPAFRFSGSMFFRPLNRLAGYRVPGRVLARYISVWLPAKDRAIWDAKTGIFVIEGNSEQRSERRGRQRSTE